MRRLFSLSLYLSETSLSSCDLLGLEVFTAFSGHLDTGKPRRTRITSSEAPQATLQHHKWAATYAWCETKRDPWVRVSLTYT